VREAGVREWWCLGDLVGYGADPRHCLTTCMSGASRCIAGNHDLGAAGRVDIEDFSAAARAALEWTQDALGAPALRRLAALEPADPDGAVPIYHGSPRDPVWEYVLSGDQAVDAMERSGAPLTMVGHTHLPAAWHLTADGVLEGGFIRGEGVVDLGRGQWLVNPGAVGQPRDGDARAAWALLDPAARTVTFRRTPYDVAAAQNAILANGLPPSLAARLARGG
jgi:diadenosine tetraphosphatase ApaH/serine/threonine PP2A family protein phosphatase